MTTTWHGYPQAEGAHPERPWWRAVVPKDPFGACWVRVDGATKPALDVWRNGGGLSLVSPDEMDARLAAYDREHPLPAPPPLCGQVWHMADGGDGTVLCRESGDRPPGLTLSFPLAVWTDDPWPPPGAVLVAGPGAPWADTREVKP